MSCKVCCTDCNLESTGNKFSIYVWEDSKHAAVGNGPEDDQSSHEGDVMRYSDEHDDTEEDDNEGVEEIMRTRSVELNEEEDWKLQELLPLNNSFIGIHFVHRLTTTNIGSGSMKIPKEVAAASPFKEQGYVGVCLDGGRFRKIPYKTFNDGRIVFGCNKWKEFAASRGLAVSTTVLIAFQHSPKSSLDLIVAEHQEVGLGNNEARDDNQNKTKH